MTIRHINPMSAARFFLIAYGLVGAFASIQSALSNADTVYAPLGIASHYAWLKLDLHINLAPPYFHTIFLAIFAYAVSGWISGFVFAYIYNLIAKYVGGIEVSENPP